MREIIDGVIYDTDKATLVVSTTERFWGSESFSTFWKVTLYFSEHGNWFFHNQRELGGIFRTKWDDGKLSPTTPEEVYDFFVKENEIELIKKYFPDRIRNA